MSKCVPWEVLHCICSTNSRSPRRNSTFQKTRTVSFASLSFHRIPPHPWIKRCWAFLMKRCYKRRVRNLMSRPTSSNILVGHMTLFMRKCKIPISKIEHLGDCSTSQLEESYSTKLPMEALRVMGGHEKTKGGYLLARGAFIPPEELQKRKFLC
jgi:hypothetical protein